MKISAEELSKITMHEPTPISKPIAGLSYNPSEARSILATDGLAYMASKGFKCKRIEYNEMLQYMSFATALLGYDYVIIDKARTQSGRYEPLQISTKAVNQGSRLHALGVKADVRYLRHEGTPAAIWCIGDLFIPHDKHPKKYADLPDKLEPVPAEDKKPAIPVTFDIVQISDQGYLDSLAEDVIDLVNGDMDIAKLACVSELVRIVIGKQIKRTAQLEAERERIVAILNKDILDVVKMNEIRKILGVM